MAVERTESHLVQFRLRFVSCLSIISVCKNRPRFARLFLSFPANSRPNLDMGGWGGGEGWGVERERHE